MIGFDHHDDVWGPRRARLIAGMLAVVFVVIVGRSAFISIHGPERAPPRNEISETIRRADILDRSGQLLATTVPGWSLAANPQAIWDAGEVANELKRVLPGIDVIGLTAQLSDRKRQFVWVQRGLTADQKQAVFDLGLEGLRFEEEPQRVYPRGRLAGHFLGYTNIDGKGLEGAELAFDERLKAGGEPLRLTLDANVQFAVEDELEKAYADFEMQGAAGIIIDAQTGAVRAMASWPAMDPNRRGDQSEGVRVNRALNSRFELGSIYKPLTVAAAMDAGVLGETERFDVSSPLRIGTVTVRDPHAMPGARAISVADILGFSSNIGIAQIAQRLGPEKQRAFLTSLHLIGAQSHDGPQFASPLAPVNWDLTAMATIAYGHGISVSPLAFAMAYTPFANNGKYVPPLFVEPADAASIRSEQVMTPATADAVLTMLRHVVTHGTGANADAQGYEVAGKTGTAEKPGPDGYDPDKNVTSFAAVFPVSRPQFVVLIVLDEAQPRMGEQRTAAYTAASIAGKVIRRAAPLLGVRPVLAASQGEATSLRSSEAANQ